MREYQPFAVVEANMPAPGQASGVKQVQGGAFRELAGFLFGGNAEGQKMSMTTPVITSDTGAMQFVLPLASADDAPAPLPTSSVQVKTVRKSAGAAVLSHACRLGGAECVHEYAAQPQLAPGPACRRTSLPGGPCPQG